MSEKPTREQIVEFERLLRGAWKTPQADGRTLEEHFLYGQQKLPVLNPRKHPTV